MNRYLFDGINFMNMEQIPGVKIKKAVILPHKPTESYVLFEWKNDILVVQSNEIILYDGTNLSVEFNMEV